MIRRVLFITTIFAGSFLLFWVQPLVGRFLLPALGGTPAVWNTAMVLFQALLLVGYGWAHLAGRHLDRPVRALGQVLLVAGAWWLVAIGRPTAPEATGAPALWVALCILGQIGAPFAILAAGGPLLQRWFARSPDPRASSPYFLFAASNAGSLLALLAFPFLLEPLLDLETQARAWRWGLAGYGVLLTACALCIHSPVTTPSPTVSARPIRLRRRLRWLGLAAVPSGFLLAVTGQITTDVAAVPLLWVLPLAVYLGTFIIAFGRRSPPAQDLLRRLVPAAVAVLLVFFILGLQTQLWFDLPLQLGALVLVGLVCHGELARDKPTAESLTNFYLWLSLGGVAGGCFAGVLAPLIFVGHLEHPLLLMLMLGLLPTAGRPGRRNRQMVLGILALAGCAFCLAFLDLAHLLTWLKTGLLLFVAAIGGTLLRYPRRPHISLLTTAVVFAIMYQAAPVHQGLLRKRNFFGTQRVVRDGDFHLFFHGTTCHGAQRQDAGHRTDPLTYFHRDGPLGRIFTGIAAPPPRTVGVLGLGIGTIAAYGRPGDRFTFFEIDPAVETTAQDARFFSFLRDSQAETMVRIGDGRLLIAMEPDASFDLIIQDAFSSDAVPVHLLTREALAIYLDKLAPDGLLISNLSSRYFTFEPLLDRQFTEAGLHARICYDTDHNRDERRQQVLPSIWAVAARREADVAFLDADPVWRPLRGGDGIRAWTDSYANILAILGSPKDGRQE